MRRPLFIFALSSMFVLAGLALAADVPVPEYMGLYAFDGVKLIKLERAFSKTETNDAGKEVVGFPANTQFAQVPPTVVFVAYHEKLELLEVNIIGLKWEGIKMVDGQELRTADWKLNMYVRDGDKIVRFNVTPVEGKAFTYKYVPETQLEPGKYLFYFGHSLKEARVAELDKVFVFEVVK